MKQLQCCNGEDDTAFLLAVEMIKRKDLKLIDCAIENKDPTYQGVSQSSLNNFLLKASDVFNVILYEKQRHKDKCLAKDGYSMFSSHRLNIGGDDAYHIQDRKLIHITSGDAQV
jgi:hypothetical protein